MTELHAVSELQSSFSYFNSIPFKNQICERSGQVLFVLLVCYFGVGVLYHDRANVSASFPRQSDRSRLWRTLRQHDVFIFRYFDSSEQYTIVLGVFVSSSSHSPCSEWHILTFCSTHYLRRYYITPGHYST